MHIRQDTGLSYFCRASLFCYSKYQDPPAEMDDFQLLPDNWGWEDTTPFKDEVHRCSILKRWVPSFTYFPRNILRAASERSPHPTNGTPNFIHLLVIRLSSSRTLLLVNLTIFGLGG